MFYFKVSKQELMVMEECTGVRTSGGNAFAQGRDEVEPHQIINPKHG
ncbi:hypothetical protein C5167_035951 [Papaver somniferum]|nr:hypothetical protein C5167_035951 [Papaver somniferum]